MSVDTIAAYGLDFLLFTDLGMDFATYGVAYSRLATYQVTGCHLLPAVK
jgi:hypothetical protein